MSTTLCDSTSTIANLIHDAALILAGIASESSEAIRFLDVAVRLGTTLDSRPTRPDLLAASPRVVERTGRVRSLIEMIEDEPGDDAYRLRLVTLLLRALSWEAAQVGPIPPRQVGIYYRELIHYRSVLTRKRLEELRRSRVAPW